MAEFTATLVHFWPFEWLYFQLQKICSAQNVGVCCTVIVVLSG